MLFRVKLCQKYELLFLKLIQILKMLRRPPTSIQLKLDDITEYEVMKLQTKDKAKTSNEPPTLQVGPKSKQEIFSRIGIVPPEQQHSNRPTNL